MHQICNTTIYRLRSENLYSRMNLILLKLGFLGDFIKVLFLTISYYNLINNLIKSEKPDILHLHWLFHPAAFASSFIRIIPIVSTPWGSDLLIPEYNFTHNFFGKLKHKFSIKKVIRSSKAFCCDAQHMKNKLIEYGAKSDTIKIIYFGTDTEEFSPNNRDLSFWYAFNLKENMIKVLSNRVLATMYDIETLIRAAKIVDSQLKDIHFIISSDGPQGTSLRQYCEELELSKIITFTGRLNEIDMRKSVASCDIYVSTSPTDGGIAASVAEAMSSAIPVVITDFGDNAFWLKNQSAGLLFPAHDENRLAAQIISLAKDIKLRKTLGEQARKIIKSDNNLIYETDKVITMYNSLK